MHNNNESEATAAVKISLPARSQHVCRPWRAERDCNVCIAFGTVIFVCLVGAERHADDNALCIGLNDAHQKQVRWCYVLQINPPTWLAVSGATNIPTYRACGRY